MPRTQSNEWLKLEDGTVVDEGTGEIIERPAGAEDPVTQYTRLALEASLQEKQWKVQYDVYRLMLKRLDIQDVTNTEGRAVLRGRTTASAKRPAWDASFLAQDLPYDVQADIWLECGKELDVKKLDERFEDGRLSSQLFDDLVTLTTASWVEVKALKKPAADRVTVDKEAKS